MMWPLQCAATVVLGVTCAMAAPAADSTPDPKSLAPPKRVVIPKLNGPVQIDGELNESVWAKAAVLGPFYKNDGSGREREQTQLRLWYDDHALYLGWTCQDVD